MGLIKLQKIYDENNVLHVKSLAEIPDNYYELMSVPITFGLYKWDDLEYIETNYRPVVNGKRVFSRYYVKRKNKLIKYNTAYSFIK